MRFLLKLTGLFALSLAACGGPEETGDVEGAALVQPGTDIVFMPFRPDVKVDIDTFAPVTQTLNCLNHQVKAGYITIKNVGNLTCSAPKLPNAWGMTQAWWQGSAVLFQVTSVGPLPASLAPGAELHAIIQGSSCNQQTAIELGTVQIDQPLCSGETNSNNNKAVLNAGAIYINP